MRRRCERFQQWIDNNGLIDLGFYGPKFTWARGGSRPTRKEARLDRALCNGAWRVKFPEGVVRHLIQACSDHSPLLIATGGSPNSINRTAPFRFQAAWMTHNQFEKLVKEKWMAGTPISTNLDNLATALSIWNREVFGNLYSRKRQLWARIEGIQRSIATGGPPYLLKLERRLRKELDLTLDQLDLLWYQKARVDQLRDGDRNTRFFHTSTIIRRRRNRISTLQDENEEWIEDPASLRDLVVNHFKRLFTEDDTEYSGSQLGTWDFPVLSADDVRELVRPFSKDDVLLALQSMHPYRAPGPDGFQAIFFQKQWHIVGDDICSTVLRVLGGDRLPVGLNNTYITLIPKIPSPEKVIHFRPIGLCNVVYKLITKCLVNKLKRVLPKLISPMQSSFIPGRQITDNIIVMQEIIHSMRRKTGAKGWMAVKLDLEKAYDRLRWGFISDTLNRMQLPRGLVDVIMHCITSSSLNVLWNGTPTSDFQPSRGLRQGDPLSPYLFVACMERLTQLIESMSLAGQWTAFPVTCNGVRISHLMFADDVVLFGVASKTQALVIKDVLDTFCAWSGQRVSKHKSSIYFSANTNEAVAVEICNVLGIPRTLDLGRHLGVPTINGRVTRATYQNLLTKVDNRLAG